MSALALVLFLVVFYILPIVPPALYEWVWQRAPAHFPHMLVSAGGHVVFNGAYYFEMWLWWNLCLLLAAIFEWWARQDDPEWTGIQSGFERRSVLLGVDALVMALFLALIVVCARYGYPVHGPLSAAAAAGQLLLIGPLFTLFRRLKKGKESLGPEPRALKEDEPPAVMI